MMCGECGDLGYLLNQSYGGGRYADDFTPVQRCDSCARYPGDEEAARAALRVLGGGEVIVPLNADGLIPSGEDVLIRPDPEMA